ncbi:thioesterase family protein [Cryomyces antarcticus]
MLSRRVPNYSVDLTKSSFDRANAWLDSIRDIPDYDRFDAPISLRSSLRLISASGPDPSSPASSTSVATTTFEFKVTHQLCNGGGTLHGGAVALIFDMCTSITIACAAGEGFWNTAHVSRTLNCTYLRPLPEGEDAIIESEVVHLGKAMGLTRGVIKRKKDGAVCYTCEHGKASLSSKL